MSTNDQILSASGFSPTSVTGLQAWYQVNASTNPASLPDLSIVQGGGTLTAAATTPVLTTNGTVNVLRWDGSASKPLLNSNAFNWTHLFIVACYTDATFSGYPGLVGGQNVDVLVGSDATQSFFDFSDGGTYSLNGTVDASRVAPRSGTLGIIQYQTGGSAYTLTGGVDIGLHKAIAGRIWKGDVALVLFYNNGSMSAGQATSIRKWCGSVCGGISTT